MITWDSNWFLLLVPAVLLIALVLMLRYTGKKDERPVPGGRKQ